MTRRAGYTISVLVLLAIACSTAVTWLLTTSGGAKWIILQLSRSASVLVEARKTEGSILSGLKVNGLQIQNSELKADVGALYLDLNPIALIRGNLEINELLLEGVSVLDIRPEKKEPPDLKWPEAPAFMRVLDGSIKNLSARGIKYQRLNKPPVEISAISCRIAWYIGIIQITDFLATGPAAVLKGTLSAGFKTPFLKADLVAELPSGAAFKKLSLRTNLSRARPPEQVAGSINMGVIFSSGLAAGLSGDAGLTVSSVNLRKLRLKQDEIRGDIIADGEVVFTEGDPFLRLSTTVSNLDLSRKIYGQTNISGLLIFNGTVEKFAGTFNFTNAGKAIESISLSGSFDGTPGDMRLTAIRGSWLDGEISGESEIRWGERISIKGGLIGSGLNPARVSPEWNGTVNASIDYELRKSGKEPIEGYINGLLRESRLRERELTGEFKTRLRGGNVIVEPLDLHGRGFDIHAAGELNTRIAFIADIRDLSGLVTDTGGSFHSQGWLSYRDRNISFSAAGGGKSVLAAGAGAEALSFNVSMGSGKDQPLALRADINGLTYDAFRIAGAHIEAKGTVSDHVITAALHSGKADVNASVAGSYGSGTWQGKIMNLSGKDDMATLVLESPAEIGFSKAGFSVSPLALSAADGERLELSANIDREPLNGYVRTGWDRINLAHANQWLSDAAVSGGSSGNLSIRWSGGKIKILEGNAAAFGSIKTRKQSFSVTNASSKIDWNEHGLSASIQLFLAEKGRLTAAISSSSPVQAALPERGEVHAELSEIDSSVFQPLLPGGMRLRGLVSGRLNGNILPERRLDIAMSAFISKGAMELENEKRKFTADVRNTNFSATWRAENLSGSVDLTLDEYGKIRGQFRIPLPARIPLSIDQKGIIDASVEGGMRASGILSSIFPGLLEDGKGDLNVDMKIGGQWRNPAMTGTAMLSNAGAYLPQAGIRLNQVKLLAHLDKNLIAIDSFSGQSGPGAIEGNAVIRLQDWTLAEYRGSIKGTRFQAVYLPGLRVLANPDLTIEGTPKKMSVRGQILIPELTALTGQETSSVRPSKDVIITDAPASAEKRLPFSLDLRVLVTLGDKVTVKADGADIKMNGSVEFTAEDLENIKGEGVLKIVKGKYGAYGVDLDIARGTVTFKGPADNPRLSIQAERKTAEVTAGVFVTGTIQKPLVKLYSRPPMPEPDIMSYLVLGHPIQGGEEVTLVAQAAGSLLSKSDSASIQDQLKRRLGLDTLDIESGQEGAFGQKGIFAPEAGRQEAFAQGSAARTQAGVTGAAGVSGQAAAGQEGVSRSLVTIGKYITPNLYISFGRSLFTNASLVRLRYKFTKHWEIETQSGTSSTGGDIFYNIQFR